MMFKFQLSKCVIRIKHADIEVPAAPKVKYGDKLREGCHYAHPPSNTSGDLDPNGGVFLRTNWQVQGFLQEQADALEK